MLVRLIGSFLIFLSLFVETCSASQHFISFIIPCYNCERTVRDTVLSIYNQKISFPFEVVCTDDCSTDNTLNILKEFERQHNNFRVFRHEQNRGGGPASNTCVEHAKGDLIFRLDSDNMLAENTVDRLVDLLDSTGCDGASVEELRFFVNKYERADSWFYRAENDICDLQHAIRNTQNPSSSGNYLYTKESFFRAGGYPTEHGTDTFRFGFKQYATGSRIAILKNSFYWHYLNPNGYWSREEAKGTNNLRALDTFIEFEEVFSPETRRLLNHHLKNNCRDFFNFLTGHKFSTVSGDALNELFLGYRLRQANDLHQALEHLKKARLLGCNSNRLNAIVSELENSPAR